MPSWFTYAGLMAIVNAIIVLLVALNVVPSANDPLVVAIVGIVNAVLLAYFHVQTLTARKAAAAK